MKQGDEKRINLLKKKKNSPWYSANIKDVLKTKPSIFVGHYKLNPMSKVLQVLKDRFPSTHKRCPTQETLAETSIMQLHLWEG